MTGKKLYTILIVEDIDEISSTMREALQLRGHRVELAVDAQQAIVKAEENRPAMILTDLDLPTFDQLLQLLRDHDDLKNIAVAVIDINHPDTKETGVKVLRDFQELDDLIDASQGPSQTT